MRKLLGLAMLLSLTACRGTYSIPLTGISWTRGEEKIVRIKQERLRIVNEGPIYVGETIQFRAEYLTPDTLLPRFSWFSPDTTLSIEYGSGVGVAKYPSEGRACVRVDYFYKPKNPLSVIERSSSNIPTCKRLTIYPR